MLFMGIDVGTTGVRTLVCNEKGEIIAESDVKLKNAVCFNLPPGYSEQIPEKWWIAVKKSIVEVTGKMHDKGYSPHDILAIACDSTSGTIIPIDKEGRPLYNALMYNDARAIHQANIINNIARDFTEKIGHRFKPSDALCKILWIKQNLPSIYKKTYKFIHAADFITGKLTENFSVSDESNSLKTGYDLIDRKWPEFIEKKLKISPELLPGVVPSGQAIGEVTPSAARELGLVAGISVRAGVTDGTASFISSGAYREGDWNSTLGTTLVVKGISKRLIKDPLGRIYCHRHPDGYWLPGGASSSGGECLEKIFKDKNLEKLNLMVPEYTPTPMFVYPLVRKGERLPFVNPEARGFVVGKARDEYELYTAYLEGVAYIEKWIYEIASQLGAKIGNRIYTSGGGNKSKPWLQIRADVLQKILVKTNFTSAALGCAILAASRTFYTSLKEAAKNMIGEKEEIHPRLKYADLYRQRYDHFRKLCRERGYE